ncbi:hypothetical protein L596_022924 [Steinernema carpocapsae]|uniref:UBX domain-containing protein n=2 Tax=Steinernema carpocapsae TaxID=34508 RepID=A0A4U5MC43_STECR|nr:hypothetical protein L596_022924 [Steinernema carpocapsae]
MPFTRLRAPPPPLRTEYETHRSSRKSAVLDGTVFFASLLPARAAYLRFSQSVRGAQKMSHNNNDSIVVISDDDGSGDERNQMDDSVQALDDFIDDEEYEDEDYDRMDEEEENEVEAFDADRLPLMFTGDESFAEKTENFNVIFESRYGSTHPLFYPGPLSDAKRQSLAYPVFEERRPLAIYVHNDNAQNRDRFPSDVLCNPLIAEYLSANYVIFGWDATQPSNKKILWDSLTEEGFNYVRMTLDRCLKHHFPLLILVIRTKEIGFKMAGLVYSNDSVEKALRTLEFTANEMQNFIREEGALRQERALRENLRQQQMEEYEASLRADRERHISAEREAEREAQAKREEQAKIAAAEAEEKRKEEEKQKRVESQKAVLPAEPGPEEPQVVRVKFAFPDKQPSVRRFRKSEPLRLLAVFAESHGYLMDEFQLIDYKMKNVTAIFDLEKTFEEVNWPSAECLRVTKKLY